MEVTLEQAKKVYDTVKCGLSSGIGTPDLGKMCVEAAVCYALGLPHGDDPPCVGTSVRIFKITLNDANWASNAIRAKSFEKIAICQLGSIGINQRDFINRVTLAIIKQILPPVLRKIDMEKEARLCEGVETLNGAADEIESINTDLNELEMQGDAGGGDADNAIGVLASVGVALRSLERGGDNNLEVASDDIASAAVCASYVFGQQMLDTAIQIGIDALIELECPGVELWKQLEAEGYIRD